MDPFTANNLGNFATAHSRGLIAIRQSMVFATAYSRGLRHVRRCNSFLPVFFATAHSCGLRRRGGRPKTPAQSLPQRIRAGCDCRQCVRNHGRKLFATAHSCGLRLMSKVFAVEFADLCHSAFVRVATGIASGVQHANALCHSAFVRVATAEKQCSALRICCEKVDSFSSVGESGLALTIFPFSFAAKATYVAINDSFGRAIDRFFGANRTGISVSYDFAEHPCL